VPFPFATSIPVVREYQKIMTDAGHTDFDFSSMEGFLTAKVFVEGLRRAGRNPTRDGLIAALESITDWDLGGFTIRYGPGDHIASSFIDVTTISRGGRFMR
jgi:branched-chain amino acid transport system substrate-binding protein